MIEILDTTKEHYLELSENLRAEDMRELACFGVSSRTALWHSWQNSIICQTAIVEGKVAGMWGVIGCLWEGVGTPWILTAPICDKYPIPFALLYRQELQRFLRLFPVLENHVDAAYSKSLKLLELMGFKLYNPAPHGLHGHMFVRARKEAS